MFLNIYKLFKTNRQKNNNYIFVKSFLTNLNDLVELDFVKDTGNGNKCTSQYSNIGTLNDSTLRLVDIKNINLTHIHNLTNKMSDVNEDNENNKNNGTDGDNRNNRDNKDDEKSSSYVLENTEHKKARK
ncbi:uncharacterized protein CIMG_13351 [Coccidioides immitis RS]|uniref:Uncharacterized protein n=2 Tax=Coccidioides immitis TaxID=5501 RepID=A0A0E1RX06_COCIM|nr:uncharacterized protein CIMG_13351 [Coccidioides immitis RS]EAS33274.1 hypothetical protein CIMG_13351 [Coccidioides immitis RS]KMP04435.1 hypothetical protein CIRG_04117 [Coccidioides immitis RMSCC 2394]